MTKPSTLLAKTSGLSKAAKILFLIVILRILIMISLGVAMSYPIYLTLPQSFERLLIMCAASVVSIAALMYLIVLNREQRQSCNRYIGRILFKKKN